ncbi:glycosyltransferase, partial [Candidatus Peregrinibacteria bacterium]|nr:glycosyltransferase [Candidatus Peregrinibacteria bacterium]
MNKISGFIIAKNEEARISTALKSLASFCDEIVVVDTGSTDKTKEIASEFTKNVFDFEWIDDFAAARNFALSKCTGQWVIFLDADDEIKETDAKLLRNLVENAGDEVAGFWLNYQYSAKKSHLLPRIFRKSLGLNYKMPVHEYLDIPSNLKNKFEVHAEINIIHHKKAEDNEATLNRNIKILEKAAIEHPQNIHIQFFLGREYFNIGDYDKAEQFFSRLANGGEYIVLLYLGKVYEKQGKYESALQNYKKAFQADARFNAPLIHQADILFYKLRQVDEARKLYAQALAVPLPLSTFPVNKEHYHDYPKTQIYKIDQLKKPMALVCGYYGKENIGDELILKSIKEGLEEKFRIVVASYSPKHTQNLHGVEAVAHGHKWFYTALQQSELVIIGGGGLFHDQGLTQSGTVEYYCRLISQAAEMKKRVILLGVGVDEIKLEKNRKLIAENFYKCEKVYVRDENSKQNLLKCGVKEELIFVMP